jgi:hypothetical protein
MTPCSPCWRAALSPAAAVTTAEADSLAFMREEEQLAHDV